MPHDVEDRAAEAVAEAHRNWRRVPGLPRAAQPALLALVAIVAVSFAVRVALATEVRGPMVFMDVLGYTRTALNLAKSGHLELFGKTGLAYSPLYSVVLAPIYALTSSPSEAYVWVKVVNALLMSLALFPIYGIARFLLSRRLALVVVALAAVAPLMFYTGLGMSENVAYPLFLLAVWAMLRALQNPGPGNDALLLGSILLACAARLQLATLIPTAVTAVLLVALVGTRARGMRVFGTMLVRHWLLLGALALASAAVVARAALNGGTLPLAGRYSNVGTAHAGFLQVLKIAVQHLAGLDLAVGVVPFAAALLAWCGLVRARFPRNGLIFGSVAVAATLWLLLEVAFDAAAFDREPSRVRSASLPPDVPRIHERYLIYLVPLFLVALIVLLRRARSMIRPFVALGAIAVAAALPAAIPFGTDINSTIVTDSFALQAFGTVRSGEIVPVADARTLAVAVAFLLASVCLLPLAGRYRPFAVVVTAVAFLYMSGYVRARILSVANASVRATLPAQHDWVDRQVVDRDVVMIGGDGVPRLALLETAFYNASISRIYYTCKMGFGADFGETRSAVDARGRLRDTNGPIRTRYAVVPARFRVGGRVLARDRKGGLVLVAPAQRMLTVAADARPGARCNR